MAALRGKPGDVCVRILVAVLGDVLAVQPVEIDEYGQQRGQTVEEWRNALNGQ
jgi:hypothetical protein